MTRFLSGLAFLALVLTGCDSAAPSATADAWGQCSSTVTVWGPSTLAPGQTGTYNASMDSACTMLVTDWTVTNGATITSTSGNALQTVTIQAGSQSFSARARVEYMNEWGGENISVGTKSVTVN